MKRERQRGERGRRGSVLGNCSSPTSYIGRPSALRQLSPGPAVTAEPGHESSRAASSSTSVACNVKRNAVLGQFVTYLTEGWTYSVTPIHKHRAAVISRSIGAVQLLLPLYGAGLPLFANSSSNPMGVITTLRRLCSFASASELHTGPNSKLYMCLDCEPCPIGLSKLRVNDVRWDITGCSGGGRNRDGTRTSFGSYRIFGYIPPPSPHRLNEHLNG